MEVSQMERLVLAFEKIAESLDRIAHRGLILEPGESDLQVSCNMPTDFQR